MDSKMLPRQQNTTISIAIAFLVRKGPLGKRGPRKSNEENAKKEAMKGQKRCLSGLDRGPHKSHGEVTSNKYEKAQETKNLLKFTTARSPKMLFFLGGRTGKEWVWVAKKAIAKHYDFQHHSVFSTEGSCCGEGTDPTAHEQRHSYANKAKTKMCHFRLKHYNQEWPRQTKPKKGQFMKFSQGHSGTKFNVNRACFPKEKHQNSQKNGRNS